MQKAKGRGPPTAGGAKSWNWVKTMKVTHTSIKGRKLSLYFAGFAYEQFACYFDVHSI